MNGVHIRLLGGFEVVKPDGSMVDNQAWRTGKTMDLLRLLALENDRPVPIPSLLAKLWPDAPESRARASLRTAASQIRHAIGFNCVERRQPGTLTLVGAEVDVEEFRDAVTQIRQAVHDEDHQTVVDLAFAVENVYAGEFHAYDDHSDWATEERDLLHRKRLEMLSAAAESGLALGRWRDTVDFASEAIRLDPTAETPHRALMRAHAELGEIGSALRVFESYRHRLAEELGVDPSPQARELHMKLLRGTA
jgi:DNA-binding SARP family transcriptional activator